MSNFNSSRADVYFGKTGSVCEWLQLPVGWVRAEVLSIFLSWWKNFTEFLPDHDRISFSNFLKND